MEAGVGSKLQPRPLVWWFLGFHASRLMGVGKLFETRTLASDARVPYLQFRQIDPREGVRALQRQHQHSSAPFKLT